MDENNPSNQVVYITKYALTAGILEAKLKEISGNMVIVHDPNGLNGVSYFHGPGREWHLNLQSAQLRATEMAQKKITSIEVQRRKLEKLVDKGFEVKKVQ